MLLQFLAFPPADLGILVVVAFAPLLLLVERRGWIGCALWGFGAGWAAFFAGIFWLAAVSIVLHLMVLVPLALFPLAGVLALKGLRVRLGLPFVLAAPLALGGVEFFRSFAATGFPWLFAGHAFHGCLPLLQTADLAGAYGLSVLAFALNGLAADAFLFWRREQGAPARRTLVTGAATLAVLLAAGFVYGLVRQGKDFEAGPRVFLVQGNIPQDIKLSGASAEQIWTRHIDLSLQARGRPVDLLIWPETMAPRSIEIDSDELAALLDMARDLDTHLLIGSTAYGPSEESGGAVTYNSAFFISPRGRVLGRYDKMHLVPGGEYLPFKKPFPVVERIVLDSLGYVPSVTPGTEWDVFSLTSRSGRTYKYAAPICYEIIFPGIVRRFAREGAQFVVNVTNEGWFKESFEFEQMMAINKFRAVESRVSVVRAANTGISAVIDPAGRVVAAVEGPDGRQKAVEGVLECVVPIDDRGTLYKTLGDLFGWVLLASLAAALVLAALPARHRRRIPGFRLPNQ